MLDDVKDAYLEILRKDILSRQEELAELKNFVSRKEQELQSVIQEEEMAKLWNQSEENIDRKQCSFLKTIYSKKVLRKSGARRSKRSKKESMNIRMSFVKWTADPVRFSYLTEAQPQRTSDFIPMWSDRVFDSNVPTSSLGEERIPDSLASSVPDLAFRRQFMY